MIRAILLCAAIAGCSAIPPKPVEVQVPVSVSCVTKVPERPVPTFGVGDWPGNKEAAQAALVDASAWESYATELEVVISGCR